MIANILKFIFGRSQPDPSPPAPPSPTPAPSLPVSRLSRAATVQNSERPIRQVLFTLTNEARKTAKSLPRLANAAERATERAESEFRTRAYAPFWDAVEQAVLKLASLHEQSQRLLKHAERYDREASRLAPPTPKLDLNIETLPNAFHTTTRLRAVVRDAQKDFQFSAIYQQRQTNQLLAVGFKNVVEAVNGVSSRVGSSLKRLSCTVSLGFSELAATQREIGGHIVSELQGIRERTEDLASEIREAREEASESAEAQREHEQQEREMLDNIQRRKRPLPRRLRDGEY